MIKTRITTDPKTVTDCKGETQFITAPKYWVESKRADSIGIGDYIKMEDGLLHRVNAVQSLEVPDQPEGQSNP